MAVPFQDAVLPSNLANPTKMNTIINRGSLVTFNYMFHKPGHDPQPLVLVTDIMDRYIRGINLHYLTFNVIKKLLYPAPGRSICDSPQVTYQYIKSINYINSSAGRTNGGILDAFRQYKRNGIVSLKKLDCDLIVNAMAITRSFDPNEIEAIRKSVRDQIRRLMNPQAAATGEIPYGQNVNAQNV